MSEKLSRRAVVRWNSREDVAPESRLAADVLAVMVRLSLDARAGELVRCETLVDSEPGAVLWHRPDAEGARRAVANLIAVARLRWACSVRVDIVAEEPAAEEFARACRAALDAMAEPPPQRRRTMREKMRADIDCAHALRGPEPSPMV